MSIIILERRRARGLLTALALTIAASTHGCDEPNEPNAIQPSDFDRSGMPESDELGASEMGELPGENQGEPPLAVPGDESEQDDLSEPGTGSDPIER